MSDIFDNYSAYELRDIFKLPTEQWPEDFCSCFNDMFAGNLLDMWLENHSDAEYREEIRQYVEDTTYGYEDKDGNEMLEFNQENI